MPLPRRTLRFFATTLAAAVTCLAAPGASCAGAEEALARRSPLGINLSKVRPYSTELPFVDVFRTSRRWNAKMRSSASATAAKPGLDLDEHGWVQSLAPGQRVESVLLTALAGRLPAGSYTLLHDGSGSIDIKGSDRGLENPIGSPCPPGHCCQISCCVEYKTRIDININFYVVGVNDSWGEWKHVLCGGGVVKKTKETLSSNFPGRTFNP